MEFGDQLFNEIFMKGKVLYIYNLTSFNRITNRQMTAVKYGYAVWSEGSQLLNNLIHGNIKKFMVILRNKTSLSLSLDFFADEVKMIKKYLTREIIIFTPRLENYHSSQPI